MEVRTLKLVTIWFCLLFGVVWAYLSATLQTMYVPPGEIQTFLVALIGGKSVQSYVEKKNGGA